ncbi:hypothetical protein TorRG33x02_297260, partial [Trema orientale]
SCPHCLSPVSSFNISESIIRSLRDPPIWDSNSDDTRHSATPPDDHRTDHVATTPLMPDDDHHHTTVATPSTSLDYIDHAVTSHIFADDQHHTATTVPPDTTMTTLPPVQRTTAAVLLRLYLLPSFLTMTTTTWRLLLL